MRFSRLSPRKRKFPPSSVPALSRAIPISIHPSQQPHTPSVVRRRKSAHGVTSTSRFRLLNNPSPRTLKFLKFNHFNPILRNCRQFQTSCARLAESRSVERQRAAASVLRKSRQSSSMHLGHYQCVPHGRKKRHPL